MPGRRIVVLMVVLGTLALPALAQARPACQPRNTRTLVSNGYARVYGKDGAAYACVRSTRRTTKLLRAQSRGDLFRLAGRYVAWTSDTDDSSQPEHAQVNELFLPNRSIPQFLPNISSGRVTGLALLGSGALAWASRPGDDPSEATFVEGLDRRGHSPDGLSDPDKDVVGSSLRATGRRTIGWRYDDDSRGRATLY